MKQTVSKYDFTSKFKLVRPKNFSYEGLQALYDYFIEYEDATDEEMELDVIAVCCEFSEYDSALECTNETTNKSFENEDCAMEYLWNHTSVIIFDDGIIIQDF